MPTAQTVLANALLLLDLHIVLDFPTITLALKKASTIINALPELLALSHLKPPTHAPNNTANLITRNHNHADALSPTPSSENAYTINTVEDSLFGQSSSSLLLPSSLFWLSSSLSSS
jgi:hypothetical protein